MFRKFTSLRQISYMKNLLKKGLLYILSGGLLLLAACNKNDIHNPSVITNNYNLSISAANQNYDYVPIDVDNDKINDFKIYTYNSTYGGFSFETLKKEEVDGSKLQLAPWSVLFNTPPPWTRKKLLCAFSPVPKYIILLSAGL